MDLDVKVPNCHKRGAYCLRRWMTFINVNNCSLTGIEAYTEGWNCGIGQRPMDEKIMCSKGKTIASLLLNGHVKLFHKYLFLSF